MRKTIHSSTVIEAVGTTPKGRDLRIQMNNNVYTYRNAGKHYTRLVNAYSPGTYLNEEIKPMYGPAKKGGK